MFLVNLTLLQFAAIFGTVSVAVLALYLWDRSRRRVTVPTLRFWNAAARAAEVRHRRRIQQPWSLLLQLLGIALLLLALAQLRLGSSTGASRDHVVVLDTSAWMAAHAKGKTLMDQAHALARAYVRSLPSGDRAMLVRADALSTPATAFETNRDVLERAIEASQPSATALNLEQAFDFARQAQKLQGGRPGEIVYVGFGRVAQAPSIPADGRVIRFLPVEAPVSNCGLRKIGLRRSATDPDVWDVSVAVQNYTAEPRRALLALAFGGSPVGARDVTVPANAQVTAMFHFRSRGAGWLEARLGPEDDFDRNHRALIEVPARRALKVLVYTDEPDALRPVFSASPEVDAAFRTPAQYQPAADADIVILDRFSPNTPPLHNAIWIEPEGRSPIPVRSKASGVALTRWRADHALGIGLRTRDVRLESAYVFQPASTDVVVADSDGGPIAVARDGETKTLVLGFHPVRSEMRYQLATPLLFANTLRWMNPETFRRWELNAGSVGTVSATLDSEHGTVAVLNEAGSPLPHTRHGRNLRFFAGSPGTVRVATASGESVYSLVLPELAEDKWPVPTNVRRGLPAFSSFTPKFVELWPWLAAAGLVVLLIEWYLFGRGRVAIPAAVFLRPAARRRGRMRSMMASVRSLFL
ncbi:MAG TPA: VWA domain-containing protein [Bryobacteraceae bacterium]|nr:VWA domain-containing protein [Bryobacteraceae bacterium]